VSKGVILGDVTASGLVGLEGISNTVCTVLKRVGLVDWAADRLPAPPRPSELPPAGAAMSVLVVLRTGLW
jgi:hypothetical protein